MLVFKLNIKNHLHISKKQYLCTEKEDKITPKIQEKEDNTIHKPRTKEDKQAFNRIIISGYEGPHYFCDRQEEAK